MPRPCLTHWGRAQAQHKRAVGMEDLHPLPPVTDPVLLVHLVSVHGEWSRAYHRERPDQSRRAGGQGLGDWSCG